MVRDISFIFCVTLIMGCNVFRNTTKTLSTDVTNLTSQATATERQNAVARTTARLQIFSVDSLNSIYKTIIWPRGKFRLSLDSGFIGEADRVEQLGKKDRLAKISSTDLKQAEFSATSDRVSTSKLSTSNVVKSKAAASKPAINYGILDTGVILILAAIAITIAVRKIRDRVSKESS